MSYVTPYYGAVFEFKGIGTVFETNDGYVYGGNLGVNNLSVSTQIILPSQTDTEASGAITEILALSGTGFFQLNDPSNIYNPIYLTIDGFETEYKLNNLTDIKIGMSANNASKSLRWTGCYINDSFVTEWSSTGVYQKSDVVRYLSGLSYISGGVVSGNATEMYFYCVSQTGVSGGSNPIVNSGVWTRWNIPLEMEIDVSSSFVSKGQKEQLMGSYAQKINDSRINFLGGQSISVAWNNLSDKDARCLLHFFENKQGFKRFNITGLPPQWTPYSTFVCPDWTHRFNFVNSHTITATISPDQRFKTGQIYTGFDFKYRDLLSGMTSQWIPETGLR